MFATLLQPPASPPEIVWTLRDRPRSGGVLTKLAPGVYIVRSRQWLPATAFDGNAELPPLTLLAAPARRFPHPAWHERAACRTLPQKLFFGDGDGARPALRRSVLARARTHCTPCEVRRDCLTWALEEVEKYGIWGGTTGRDRKLLQLRIRQGELVSNLVDEVLNG